MSRLKCARPWSFRIRKSGEGSAWSKYLHEGGGWCVSHLRDRYDLVLQCSAWSRLPRDSVDYILQPLIAAMPCSPSVLVAVVALGFMEAMDHTPCGLWRNRRHRDDWGPHTPPSFNPPVPQWPSMVAPASGPPGCGGRQGRLDRLGTAGQPGRPPALHERCHAKAGIIPPWAAMPFDAASVAALEFEG